MLTALTDPAYCTTLVESVK